MGLNFLIDVGLGFKFGSDSMPWLPILCILCGLGIFLYGINMMGSSLKAATGNKMKGIIEKATKNPFLGLLIGFLITMLTQSASGTSALAVSLVAAGLMTFEQSLGILLGANIGGTLLPLIMSALSGVKIMPIAAVLLVFIGAALVFFFKKEKVKQIGNIVLGFGLIFLGLVFIDISFKQVLDVPSYKAAIIDLFTKLEAVPVLGVIVGTLFTFVVQSSSATIGIVQTMYTQGTIGLSGALAIMLGANIGTTITALIASMGSSRTAKRVAVANTLIKFFGVLVVTIIFSFAFEPLVRTIAESTGLQNLVYDAEGVLDIEQSTLNSMSISFAHIAFNIVNSLLFIPLLKPLSKLCYLILKDKKETEENQMLEHLLDYSLIKKSTDLALAFVKSSIDYMASCVKEYVSITEKYSVERDDELLKAGAELEKTINCLDKRIHDYLIKLTLANLDKNQSVYLSKYLDQIKDLERIGDHCTNILDFFLERYEKEMHLSDDGAQDLSQIFGVLIDMVDKTCIAISKWDNKSAEEAAMDEDEIDRMEEVFHERHVHRVDTGACTVMNGEHYVEILSNIERMGDHLKNICDGVLSEEYCKYDEYNH